MEKIFLVCGLPGAGKTTVAKILAKKIKGLYCDIDTVKRDLLPKGLYEKCLRYQKPWPTQIRIRAYQKIWPKVLKIVTKKPVVLDELFHLEKTRKFILKRAKKLKIPVVIIEVKANKIKIRKWLEKRNLSKSHTAGVVPFGMHEAVKKSWQPIKEKHFIIDNKNNKENLFKAIKKLYDQSRKNRVFTQRTKRTWQKYSFKNLCLSSCRKRY